jgi:hypothetical protein
MKTDVMGDDSPRFFFEEMDHILSTSEGDKICIWFVFYYSDQVAGKAAHVK